MNLTKDKPGESKLHVSVLYFKPDYTTFKHK
jgi:hypothetical protein